MRSGPEFRSVDRQDADVSGIGLRCSHAEECSACQHGGGKAFCPTFFHVRYGLLGSAWGKKNLVFIISGFLYPIVNDL